MKKPVSGAAAPTASGSWCDPEFQLCYPSLGEHLADTKWDDGSPREVSTVTVKVEGGRFNLSLNDREERSSAYVTADTLHEGLRLLDEGILSGRLDWRPWGGRKKK